MPTPNRPIPARPISIARCRRTASPRPRRPGVGCASSGWCPTGCCAPRPGALRETLEAVLELTGYIEQRLDERIYEATPGTLASLVDEHREAERLLLVGHNPGLERLAALMHSGQTGDYRGMPTASIALLALPLDATIEPGIARLTAFWWP